MAGKMKIPSGLDYLMNKPKKVKWRIVAGEDNLHPIQMYDLVFDEHDYRIRQLAA